MFTEFNKIYSMEIDLKNLEVVHNSKALYSNVDLNTSTMMVKLSMDNKSLNLTDTSIIAYIKAGKNNNVTMERCNILDPTEGIIGLDLKSSSLQAGTNTFFLEIKSNNGEIINSPLITYKVVELFDVSEGTEGDNDTTILRQLISEVEVIKESVETLRDEIIADEEIRKSNESTRVQNEQQRDNSETNRETAETSRTQSESVRVENEKSRIAAESNRVENEKSRVSAESGRVSSESERVLAETKRADDFENIKNEMLKHMENCSVEKLLARYVHQGNKEIYFSDIDYDTGIATTTEPHGITEKTEIMIVPNDWTLENYRNNIMSVPIEYTKNSDRITITRVSDNKLKIAKNDGETLINVNKEDVSNANVDCTKFHFEIPIPFIIDNIEASNHIRLVYIGYAMSCNRYRYTTFKFASDDDILYDPLFYISHLGLPKPANALSTHCVFIHLNQVWDFREPECVLYNKSTTHGRRHGYSNIVWDRGIEQDIMNYQCNRRIKYIKKIQTHGPYSSYAYLSNNSVLSIYDLGGV